MTFKVGDRVYFSENDNGPDGEIIGTVRGVRRNGEAVVVRWDGANHDSSYHSEDIHLVPECHCGLHTAEAANGEHRPLFKVGDKVKLPHGTVGLVIEVDSEALCGYPYRVGFTESTPIWCPGDGLELVPEEPKKILNLWEAREAALAGKKVRVVGGIPIYSEVDFTSNNSWFNTAFNEDWEIVEEPRVFKSYLNVYEDGHGQAWNTKKQADIERTCTKTNGCIEIVTDENGQLVSARNI